MSIRCGSVAGVSLVLAAVLAGGAWAQDEKPKVDARALERELRDAKNALQAVERGQLPDSPAVVEARTALAKAIEEQAKKRQADRAAKPGIAALDTKLEGLKAQQKDADGKLAEARKKLDADAELAALKKAADDALAAYRKKVEEKTKADQGVAAAVAAADQVKAEMTKAQQDAVMLVIGDSAEYKALKTKVSELDAKIAEAKKAEEAAKAEREKAAKEKAAKKAEKKPEAQK